MLSEINCKWQHAVGMQKMWPLRVRAPRYVWHSLMVGIHIECQLGLFLCRFVVDCQLLLLLERRERLLSSPITAFFALRVHLASYD